MHKPLTNPPAELRYDHVSLDFVRIIAGEPERGHVPYYHFRIKAPDGADVGHINFRVGDTEHVLHFAGHVGYQIAPPFRGHGYALQACRALAPFIRTFYDAVILTCDPDNIPSIRTIEKLGATFLEEIAVSEREPAYRRGARTKRRYAWKP